MDNSKRKVLGSVLGIIIFIICILSLSYAWYRWRSANTDVDIGIHEGGLKFVYSNNNILESSTLSPILDYKDESYYENNNGSLIYADYTTTNTTNDTYKMIIKLNITSISDVLKNSTFKWALLEKNGSSYSKVVEEGDFSSVVVGGNILNEGIYVPPSSPTGSTSTDYRFVIYIDGNQENSSGMMNSAIKADLELCDEKVPLYNISLDDQGATSGQEGTAKIYEKYGVGIYKDSTASTTLMTTTANPITVPSKTGYTFNGYYTSTSCGGDQLISNSGYITSKFSSTYTNKDMTLYACWKDTTAPTLTLTRTGTVDGFKGWNLTSGASVDSSQILTLASTSAIGTSPFYQVDEEKYEWSYDAYTTAAASEHTPNGGNYTSANYYDNSFASKVGDNGYAANGQSTSIPLNTWKSIGASNYNYGTGIEYFKIIMIMSSSWSMPTTKYRNFKMMGDIYAKRKYTINVSSSDSGSGIKVKKYASGSQTASYFKSNGTTFTGNSFNVTANGTYTVYIEDNSRNTTVKTIAINKIDNAIPNISSFTASSDYAQTSTISATATDNLAGIVSYAFTSSNTEPTSWTTINTNKSAYTVTNTVSSNGTYYVWFMDSASNIASKSVSVTKVDKTKPVCTIATPTSVVYGSTTTVAVSCTDNASMPSQTLSTSNFTTSNNTVAQITAVSAPTAITNGYKYTLTVKGVGVGSYNISMNAGVIKDSAGNTNNKVTSGNGSVTAKNISSTTITLNPTTYVYDGKAKTPTVTVKDGSTTLKGQSEKINYTIGNYVTFNNGNLIYDSNSAGNTSSQHMKVQTYMGNTYLTQPYAVDTVGYKSYTFTKTSSFDRMRLAMNGNKADASVWIDCSNLENGVSYTISFNIDKYETFHVEVSDLAIYKTSSDENYAVGYYNNVNVGTATVVVIGKGNYQGTVDKTFTITKANSSISLSPKTATYTGSAIAANKATVTGTTGAVTYTYYTNSSCSTQTTTSTGASGTGKAPVDVGNYYVKATAAASSNYNSVTSSCVAHTINKKSVAVTWGSTTTFTYNGSAQAPTVTTPVTGVGSEKLNLTRTTATAVGTHTSTASCSSVTGGRAKCANYTLTGNTKSFTISYKTFNITLDDNGATSAGTSKLYVRYAEGIYLDSGYTKKMTTTTNPITIPTWAGHIFNGYYDGSTKMIDSTGKITSNFTTTKYSAAKTLTAKWTINSYTVTYNYSANGGTSATKTTATVNYGSAVDLTPTATKSGWTFVGWNTSQSATTKLNSLTMGTSNITLYAIYKKTGQVTFNLNGNTSFNYNGSSYTATKTFNLCTMYNTATSCTVSVTMPTITAPANTPTVIGWSNSATNRTATYTSGQTGVTLTSGSTWYAQTRKNAVTLTASFNANGATLSSTASQSCTLATTYNGTAQATSCTVTAPTITRSGYTIDGFNTSASSTSNNSAYNASTKKITLNSSLNNKTWYAITHKNVTATFYYYSSGVKNTKASCPMYNKATTCSVTVPTSTFSSTTSQYGASYVGYGAVNTMGTSTATSATISANTSYYVSYRKSVTEYYQNKSRTVYRNAFFTSSSAMSTVLSTSTTGITNLSGASYTANSIRWSWYGYATSSSATSRTYSSVAAAAKSTTTTLYTMYSRSVSATFYYYNGSSQATTTASGTQLANYKASVVSNGNITVPTTVTNSSGPSSTGTNCSGTTTTNTSSYYGVSSSVSSTTKTTPKTNVTKYYAIYKSSFSAYYNKGVGINTIGSTTNSCTNYKTTNGTTYSSSSCNVTLPAINALDGYVSQGWFKGTTTSISSTTGLSPSTSVSLTANACYTARSRYLRADELIYDNTLTGEDCDTAQCMIDRINELIENNSNR